MDGIWTTCLQNGPATYMGRPWIDCDAETIKKYNAKAAVLGYPIDSTIITRTGTAMGPRKIRDVSCQSASYHNEYDVDIFDEYNLVDVGDIPIRIGHTEDSLYRGRDFILEILKAGAMPVLIGGEHSISTAPALAFKEFTPNANYGVILVDSHYDTSDNIDGEKWHSCTPITRMHETGIFNPKNTVLLGIGGSLNPKSEEEYCIEHGVTVFSARDIFKRGIDEIAKEAVKVASEGTDGVYLTIDIDFLEASQAPGCAAPTPGGMTAREFIHALDIFGELNLIGMDVCEVSPAYDHSDITAIYAQRFIVDMLASRARYLKDNK